MTIDLDWFEMLGKQREEKPLERFLLEDLEDDVAGRQSILKQFLMTSPPRPTVISPCEAAEYFAGFIFEHTNMPLTPVHMHTLAIAPKSAVDTLRMYDAPEAGLDPQFDYAEFINSIKLV